MAIKQVKILKLRQFFGNFLALRENYPATFQAMFNREIGFWESFLHNWPQPAF